MTQGQQRGDHDLINAQPSVEFAPAKTSIRVDWQSAEQSTAGSNLGAAWLSAAAFRLVKGKVVSFLPGNQPRHPGPRRVRKPAVEPPTIPNDTEILWLERPSAQVHSL
jgi:hypothetical protein